MGLPLLLPPGAIVPWLGGCQPKLLDDQRPNHDAGVNLAAEEVVTGG